MNPFEKIRFPTIFPAGRSLKKDRNMKQVETVLWKQANKSEQMFFKLDFLPISVGIGHEILSWQNNGLSNYPYYRIHFPVSGEYEIRSLENTVLAQSGYLYFLPRHEPLRFCGIQPSTHYFFHFDSVELSKILPFRSPLCVKSSPDFREIFEELLLLRRQERKGEKLLREKFLMHRLIYPFYDQLFRDQKELLSSNEQFRKVIDYIELMLDKDITVEELEGIAGMSRAKFSAEFRRIFGLGPKQYISISRIARAKKLLLETNLPCREIAEMTGFHDVLFFYKMFKKYVHITPSSYRKSSIAN